MVYRELPDIDVLAQALSLSRPVLLKDPCQLASQLLGRLLHIAAQDKPVAPGTMKRHMKHFIVSGCFLCIDISHFHSHATTGDPKRFSFLHELLKQCQYSSVPVLVPSYSCLLPPGGITHTLLAGKTVQTTWFTLLIKLKQIILACTYYMYRKPDQLLYKKKISKH